MRDDTPHLIDTAIALMEIAMRDAVEARQYVTADLLAEAIVHAHDADHARKQSEGK